MNVGNISFLIILFLTGFLSKLTIALNRYHA